MDTLNLKGLAHSGAPSNVRSSSTIPASETSMVAAISTMSSSNGRCQVRLRDGVVEPAWVRLHSVSRWVMVVIASSVVDGVDARDRCLTVSSKLEDARDA
jgi:hypothetical protein